MKTLIIALALLGATAAQAGQKYDCWVVGQNSQNPNNFTELTKQALDIDLGSPSKSQIIYNSAKFAASFGRNEQGNLVVSTIKMPGSELAAVAIGGSESVQLIDPANKTAVLCRAK